MRKCFRKSLALNFGSKLKKLENKKLENPSAYPRFLVWIMREGPQHKTENRMKLDFFAKEQVRLHYVAFIFFFIFFTMVVFSQWYAPCGPSLMSNTTVGSTPCHGKNAVEINL